MGIKPISDHKPPVKQTHDHHHDHKAHEPKTTAQSNAADRSAVQKAVQQNPGSHPPGCGCPTHSGNKAPKVEHEHTAERALLQKAAEEKPHAHKAGDGCPVCTGDKAAKLDKGNSKDVEQNDLRIQKSLSEFSKSEKSSSENLRSQPNTTSQQLTVKLGNLFPSHTQVKLSGIPQETSRTKQPVVNKAEPSSGEQKSVQASPVTVQVSAGSEKIQILNSQIAQVIPSPSAQFHSPQVNHSQSQVTMQTLQPLVFNENGSGNSEVTLLEVKSVDFKNNNIQILKTFSAKDLALINLSLKAITAQDSKQLVKNEMPVLKPELREQTIKVLAQPMISFQILKNELANRMPDKQLVKLIFALVGRQFPEGETPDLEGAWGIWRDYIKNRSKNKEEQNSQKRKKQVVPVLKKRKSNHEF